MKKIFVAIDKEVDSPATTALATKEVADVINLDVATSIPIDDHFKSSRPESLKLESLKKRFT